MGGHFSAPTSPIGATDGLYDSCEPCHHSLIRFERSAAMICDGRYNRSSDIYPPLDATVPHLLTISLHEHIGRGCPIACMKGVDLVTRCKRFEGPVEAVSTEE